MTGLCLSGGLPTVWSHLVRLLHVEGFDGSFQNLLGSQQYLKWETLSQLCHFLHPADASKRVLGQC